MYKTIIPIAVAALTLAIAIKSNATPRPTAPEGAVTTMAAR